jgi:predicted enzyme related to lactoylglutathione lyase
MSGLNSQINRVVWCDVPVADLGRASTFYRAVLGINVHQETFGDISFAVLDHQEGNGGCLVVKPSDVGAIGPLVYFNVNGRLAQATAEAEKLGGRILERPHSIGPHGSRAILIDSEGNRIALHSEEAVQG